MNNVSITIDYPVLKLWLHAAPEKMRKGIQNITRKVALLAERYSKQNTPVDTGRLRSSISSTIRPMSATISTHTNYARFVHDGTRRMRPRPFMADAEKQVATMIDDIIAEEVGNALK